MSRFGFDTGNFLQEWAKWQSRTTKIGDRFSGDVSDLEQRVVATRTARQAPTAEDVTIGTARATYCAAWVFDLRGFSALTRDDSEQTLEHALRVLDLVIPGVTGIVFDNDGYVEKNTGDGVFALFGVGQDQATGCTSAVNAALETMWLFQNKVNPYLAALGQPSVHCRIGIAHGRMLLGRLGLPKGSSSHDRSFLTAIGPAANIATRIQQNVAQTDEIVLGHSVLPGVALSDQASLVDVTPAPARSCEISVPAGQNGFGTWTTRG